MTQRLAVPVGRVKFVLYDDRVDSPTKGRVNVWILGRPSAYHLLIIPPGIWYGFQGVDSQPSLIANCPDLPHDPTESEKRPASDPAIPYRWRVSSEANRR
jgi:dTDP-4-dehydrorhamnose 3,5-epimerase